MNKKKRNITQNKYVFIGMTEIRKKAYFSQYKGVNVKMRITL